MRNHSFIKIFVYAITVFSLLIPNTGFAETHRITSPDRSISLSVSIEDDIHFSIQKNQQTVLHPSNISLRLEDGTILGSQPTLESKQNRTVDEIVKPIVKEKTASIRDHYNELLLTFNNHYALRFRAYNNGTAYRWETSFPNEIIIQKEDAVFQFSQQDYLYYTKDTDFQSNYEKPYVHSKIAELSSSDFGGLPVLVETANRIKLLIAESGLRDYPGLWLRGNHQNTLDAIFPQYPKELSTIGKVTSRENFIAKTEGTRAFPWRIVSIAEDEKDLLMNQLVYLLADSLQIDDPSWIKPGQVILDWWGRRNIFGVDFEAGVNTATMKYFIDFCAEFGIDYFLLDEGWSTREDILHVNPDVDMEAVLAYGKEKNVGIMLWVYWKGLDNQLIKALDQFKAWGVEGIKIDFMDRDDQLMVNFYHNVSREAALRNMVIDFHGAYKPAGLRRAYPNVLTREGFIEFEYNGWTNEANPELHMLLPFIRMVSGPVDYIPGTLNNATKKNFRPVGDMPMGQGTRAHSFALAVIMESPMRMLPDSPSDYWLETECTRFLTEIPVEWDETRILEAKLGDYITLARKYEDTWYVAAATDWDARDTTIDFSFLSAGTYHCEIIQDGPNAHNRARDYQRIEKQITPKEKLAIHLAPGGGWIAKIKQLN